MHIVLGIAFGLVAVAPFIGRWRANVWLKNNTPRQHGIKIVPDLA